MRIAKLRTKTGPRFARIDGSRARGLDGAPWDGGGETGESWEWSDADLLCPVSPSKILCVGRNYAAHAREMGNDVPAEPLLFLKPPSALLGPGGVVLLPRESTRVEHEAELAIVLGARVKGVARDAARANVLGYVCACDVTARDLQRKDVQFTRAKGFDTFCPVGPWIDTDIDPGNLRIRCRVNGETRQDGSTSDMIFDVATIVAYASRMMTLEPGDVLLTGTPDGTGAIAHGDKLEVDIEGVGVLRLGVARAEG
jgi:2-keto-4-pentenoate hydratase/2-oxohepta-3-ene-1,7-dioic acid hydratase in catechol pathway